MIALLQEEGTGRNLEAASCSAAAAAAAARMLRRAWAFAARKNEEAFTPELNYAAVKTKRVTGNGARRGFYQSLLRFIFPKT